MEIDLTQKEDLSLKYTKLVILALKSKMKEFNLVEKNKVSFEQLKIVFMDAAEVSKTSNIILYGFASINLYLRNNSKQINVILGRKILNNSILCDEDFKKAEDDLIRFNLDFNITNINELYLTRKEGLSLLEQYL